MPKKRPADEPLDDLAYRDSPSSKKARVVDEPLLENGGSNEKASNGTHASNGSPNSSLKKTSIARVSPGSGDESSEDEEEDIPQTKVSRKAPEQGYQDLYLDTINRSVLDFDFEKLCSVTLSNINVYACLVCGKYFQGRGLKTPAYTHALDTDHHVYVNVDTKKVYVLPEGYEVLNKSLDDIRFVIDPRFEKDVVLKLDKEKTESRGLDGKWYRPGFVGMNNIKANDYFNVVVQAIAHITPLRNFFMLENLESRNELVQRFSTLVRKIWNNKAFKAHVSPHELLQQISRQSQKKFDLLNQSDPADFLNWFINNLHLGIGGSKTKPASSIIQKAFQGQLRVESQQITEKTDERNRIRFEDSSGLKTDVVRYMMLTLDLPPAPLFQDELEKSIIPQVPLQSLLAKYDGIKIQELGDVRRRHRLLHPLPPFLLFHIKRFTKNKFISERNPTIVTFSPRALNMSPYVEPNPSVHPPGEPIWYDLVANITHEAAKIRDDSVEGEAERKIWRVQLRDKARDDWLEIQDLFVEKANAETLFTKESYLEVWERRR